MVLLLKKICSYQKMRKGLLKKCFCMIASLAAHLYSTVNKFVMAIAQDRGLSASVRENRVQSINCKFLHLCCNNVFWHKTACEHPKDNSICSTTMSLTLTIYVSTFTLSAKIKPLELECTRVTKSWFLVSDMCVCLSTTRAVIVIYDERTVSAVIPPKAQ